MTFGNIINTLHHREQWRGRTIVHKRKPKNPSVWYCHHLILQEYYI